MTTIDTHTHVWGADEEPYPWVGTDLPPGWSGAYTHDDLIGTMDANGVDEAVVVTPPLYGNGPDANAYTLDSLAAHPHRLWGVGSVDPFASDVAHRIRDLATHDRVLGIRLYAAFEYDPVPSKLDRNGRWILDERLRPLWETAVETGSTVYVFPKAQQLDAVIEVADRYPDLTLVVDHMAWPDETTAPDEPPWDRFAGLAAYENVSVKVSSLPRASDDDWPYTDLHGYVRCLVEWFGADRLLLGSDYPWMDTWASYDECLSWVDECASLSSTDRAWLRHRTFERLHTD